MITILSDLTPVILFGALVIFAIVLGSIAMDEAAKNRKQQQK